MWCACHDVIWLRYNRKAIKQYKGAVVFSWLRSSSESCVTMAWRKLPCSGFQWLACWILREKEVYYAENIRTIALFSDNFFCVLCIIIGVPPFAPKYFSSRRLYLLRSYKLGGSHCSTMTVSYIYCHCCFTFKTIISFRYRHNTAKLLSWKEQTCGFTILINY